MKRCLSIVTLVCTAALAGCAHFCLPNPSQPHVVQSPSGYLVVNQEPVVVNLSEGLKQGKDTIDVTWQLDPKGSLRFGKDGIVVLALEKTVTESGQPGDRLPAPNTDINRNLFGCQFPSDDGLSFTCKVSVKTPIGLYSYQITAEDTKARTRVRLDPTIMIRN